MKLVLHEPESEALRAYLESLPDPVTSRVSSVEVHRAISRVIDQAVEEALAPLWERVGFVEVSEEIANRAARVQPPTLRALDAIHLASALAVGDELDAFVTYDTRLAEAARVAGLRVTAPG